MKLTWLGQGGFLLGCGGRRLPGGLHCGVSAANSVGPGQFLLFGRAAAQPTIPLTLELR